MDNASAPLVAPAVIRHDEFYLTDEMTVFQVENRLFRVHRHFLAENSPVFRSMFSLPRIPSEASAAAVEGASDEDPIYLSGVTELEFETLLRFFYKSTDVEFSLPRSSWIALLSIAHRYEFLNAQVRAILEIYDPGKLDKRKSASDSVPDPEPPDCMTLVLTAEKHGVPLWLALPAYVELVMRETPPTEVEIARLDTLTLHRLICAREEYLRTKGKSSDHHNAAKGVVWDFWPWSEND